MFLQAIHSYAPDEKTALYNAYELWRYPALGKDLQSEIKTPALFDEASKKIKPEDLIGLIRISADLNRHIEWLKQDIELGFEQINIFNTGRNQGEFIKIFGQYVLPEIRA